MAYAGKRIDLDVHHTWRRTSELAEYLPRRWRDFIAAHPEGTRTLLPPLLYQPGPHGMSNRVDAIPPEGVAGSSYEMLRDQLLDPFAIETAVLSFNSGFEVAVPNVELSTELARAANRWSSERWLSNGDPRLAGSILLPTQLPQEAAAEIRKWADDPRMVEALLVVNGVGVPFGHPVYHPIYEAAEEAGLPVGIHIGGDVLLQGTSTHISAAGIPQTRLERHVLQIQPLMHYMLSFIVHGVFERYPSLHVVIKETGIAWLPAMLAELSALEPALRAESDWVRRPPAQYIRDHMRFTTHPLDDPGDRATLQALLESVEWIDEVLVFSSDYPHHDADDPDYLARRLPQEWLPRIFYDNAASIYPLPVRA